MEKGTQNFLRCVPGKEMVSDSLTKWYGDGFLEKVMGQADGA